MALGKFHQTIFSPKSRRRARVG